MKFSPSNKLLRIISIATLAFFVALSLSMKPRLKGDGKEYYLMIESFINHRTPDLRDEDILSFKEKNRNSWPER